MELSVRTLFLGLNPTIINQKQSSDLCIPNFSCRRARFAPESRNRRKELFSRRETHKHHPAVWAALSGLEDVRTSSLENKDVSFTISETVKHSELKIHVEVSGVKTRAIFDDVFDKMVAAAQPIPGFRRVKGGKTPNIPKDVLLEVLGPSKVYKQVIKNVINSTIAEYVEKEGLKVRKELRVDKSYEDLEEAFEPGETFTFEAIIKLQETS